MPAPQDNDALKKECIRAIDDALTHSWVVRDRLRALLQGLRGAIVKDKGPFMDDLAAELANQ